MGRKRLVLLPLEISSGLDKSPWIEYGPGKMRRSYRGFEEERQICQDCKKLAFTVILNDCLWHSLHLEGIICAECVEKRLGRKLTIKDLADCGWKRDLLWWLERSA